MWNLRKHLISREKFFNFSIHAIKKEKTVELKSQVLGLWCKSLEQQP